MTHSEVRDMEVWNGQVATQVLVGGDGPPVVFLHAVMGLQWDPFLDALAQNHTVYAPYLPGTVPGGNPDAHKPLEDVWDLVLCYYEIFDALGLDSPAVVGHSFGGMLGAELAATTPQRVSKLVLFCPIGLWTDGRAWQNPYLLSLPELGSAAFADPSGPIATAALTLPEDPAAMGEAVIGLTWAMGVAGKFWWPIPDRGLDRRIHRITAPSLVVWGEADGIISADYAADFGRLITNCQVEVLPGAAHVPQLERFDVVAPMVEKFLAG